MTFPNEFHELLGKSEVKFISRARNISGAVSSVTSGQNFENSISISRVN